MAKHPPRAVTRPFCQLENKFSLQRIAGEKWEETGELEMCDEADDGAADVPSVVEEDAQRRCSDETETRTLHLAFLFWL